MYVTFMPVHVCDAIHLSIEQQNSGIWATTVHDTENLTFSADYRAGNPHIAARPSAYVRTDK